MIIVTLLTLVAVPIMTVFLRQYAGSSSFLPPQLFDFLFLLFVAVNVLGWLGWFLKLPRLELSSKSIRYVTFGYALEAAWNDVERIEQVTKAYQGEPKKMGHRLVARKFALTSSFWARLLKPLGYMNSKGIALEPYFTSDIYHDELGDDIKRHAPHVFENNPYLV